MLFCVWTPPNGWSLPPPTACATGDEGGGDSALLAASLPEYAEEEMKCVIRLCCRMIGGSKQNGNLISMCRALAVPTCGSGMVLQRRIGQELRARKFHEREFQAKDQKGVKMALPSHHDVTPPRASSELTATQRQEQWDRTDEWLSQQFSETAFRLPQIIVLLESICSDPPGAEPAACQQNSSGSVDSAALKPENPSQPRFADLELAQLGESKSTCVVSIGEQTPAPCLQITKHTIKHAERRKLTFYDQISVAFGSEQPHVISRCRDALDDRCPVFEYEGRLVRLRLVDIFVGPDGGVWLYGCCLYTKAQLPSQARAIKLHSGFDDKRELIESVDHVWVPATDLRAILRVVSTKTWRELGVAEKDACCHQEASFVEEFEDKRKWKTTVPVQRSLATEATMAGTSRRHCGLRDVPA